MNTVARIAAALFTASLTLAAPLVASADQKPREGARPEASAGASKHDRAIFPMKASEFQKIIEKRIERIKAQVERSMTKHALPAPARVEVTRAVEAAVKDMQSTLDKASADGSVTKDEAKEIRDLATQLREKLREQLKDKGPRAKVTKPKAKRKAS
jgi:hypothetical protein